MMGRKVRLSSEEQRKRGIARSIANVAVSRGKMKRQPCSKCGAANAQKHHEDYDKPLEVVWLCHACHQDEHNPQTKQKKLNLRRRCVRHGGTLCSKCLKHPPASSKDRYCLLCRAADRRARRKREREELERLRALEKSLSEQQQQKKRAEENEQEMVCALHRGATRS